MACTLKDKTTQRTIREVGVEVWSLLAVAPSGSLPLAGDCRWTRPCLFFLSSIPPSTRSSPCRIGPRCHGNTGRAEPSKRGMRRRGETKKVGKRKVWRDSLFRHSNPEGSGCPLPSPPPPSHSAPASSYYSKNVAAKATVICKHLPPELFVACLVGFHDFMEMHQLRFHDSFSVTK